MAIVKSRSSRCKDVLKVLKFFICTLKIKDKTLDDVQWCSTKKVFLEISQNSQEKQLFFTEYLQWMLLVIVFFLELIKNILV